MARQSVGYLAYLLRVWPATDAPGTSTWRASVEDVHTGVRPGFGSLDHVVAFLVEQTTTAATTGPDLSRSHPTAVTTTAWEDTT